MARIIRKLEDDDHWIVYCNTADKVFPDLFNSLEEAEDFVGIFNATGQH